MHHRALHILGTSSAESVAQYHAPQTAYMKSQISDDMQSTSGKIRILLATEAYGMGADPPDVRQVVHVGPPSTLESNCFI